MESLERDLHCPVCLDVYTKPVLMLPCQHNLCRQCVQNIVYTQDEDDEGYRGGPGRPSAFPCPQCRQCTYLGRRGIDGLKRNILVENIVDSYREVAAQIKKKVVCAEHEDERPSLYCSSHEKAICALCKLVGEHKECEVQELKNVLAEKKMQLLEDRSNLLDRFIQENKTLSKSVEVRQVLTSFLKHKDMVRRETLALFSIISKRQSTLYDKLEVEKEEKLASLSGQVTRCEEEKGRVAALVRDAEVLMKEEEPTRFVEVRRSLYANLEHPPTLSEELTPCVDEEFEHCLVDFKEAQDMLKKLDFVEGKTSVSETNPRFNTWHQQTVRLVLGNEFSLFQTKTQSSISWAGGAGTVAAGDPVSTTVTVPKLKQVFFRSSMEKQAFSVILLLLVPSVSNFASSRAKCNRPPFQLDWMSAPQCLRLSNYNTTITHMPNRGHQPFGPHHVLADISVNSGRIYWEVFVGNSRGFRVGVTYDRDYPAREFLGGNNYSWALRYDYMCTLDGVIRFQAIHDCREVVVEVDTLPRSLGVLLDYDRGRLSCYNVGRGHIFTFFCSFREPIVPAFDVWKGSINIRTGLPPNSL
uniref:Uncharacterized protein n=1 Tax=Branchiostoma floridae TaxID=7739 RepID=C3XZN4_BRAFL|eukprot:XP_002610545.1 hypothetical protein BRAFLDRAFT_202437 [Branchiostoma floridae]